MPTEPGVPTIREFLLARLVELLGVERNAVDHSAPLHRYGLESLKSAALVASLEEFLGRPVPITMIWDHPSIDGLSRALAGDCDPVTEQRRPVADHEPIALVGVGCRLPGAPDPASYWQLLVNGRDAVGAVPQSRRELLDGASARWGGFIDDVDLFDPLFFGISPREASAMDPQQRIVLELVWEALEDAGVAPGGLGGSDTGVFMGSSWSDYTALAHRLGTNDHIGPHTATGTYDSLIANRVSYVLGLRGPSMAVDTACSSSLVAVHLACQSIWSGESSLAIAGGVNLNLFADHFLAMERVGALSPDGRCKTFDARANGYVRAEGAAVVVLAPLHVALSRGLPVYCLVRGSAVNNDGMSNGLTAPNPRAQEEVLRAAYRRAGISPSLVDYVECHGTGTPLGDPIEAKAIGEVLGRDRSDAVRIGSVKTNIGHLEPAAGVAGLVKLALSIRNGVLPASLHYSSPNPRIPFAEANLQVQDRTTEWPRRSDARRAGVSAFGFGGANCHVVVEELPQPEGSLLLLAEDSQEALSARVADLLSTDLADVCGRAPGDGRFRLAAAARNVTELRAQLEAFADGREHPGLTTGESRTPRVAFLCSGTGSQWLGMARQLLNGMPAFRRSLLRGDERMRELLGFSVVDELLATEERARLDDMEVVQPLLFCIQVALADAWRSLGVTPDLVLGQSIGEFAAAYIAGALDFDDASLLAATHARLVQRYAVGLGEAVVVAADADQLAPYLGDVTLAGRNGPSSTLVSGATAAIRAFVERVSAEGIACHRVRMGYASHSPLMEPVLAPLRAEIDGITPHNTSIPMISTVTGKVVDRLDPDYWVDNVRQESRLADALQTMAEHDIDFVVELSPHPVALKPVLDTGVTCLPSLQRGADDGWSMLSSLGALHVAGLKVTAGPFLSGTRGRHVAPSGAVDEQGPLHLVPMTAHSPEALRDTCRELSNHVERDRGLRVSDLAYTLATRRTHLKHRVAVLARDRQELLDGLARVTAGEPDANVVKGDATNAKRVAFVFSGSGTQWSGMGLELLQHNGFRERMEQCDAVVRELTGWSVLEEISAPAERSRLDQVDVQHPVLFALQVSLARVWSDLGVTPAALVGHSIGEVAAAVVAGALSLEDGAKVAVARSRLIQHDSGPGAMIAVELPEQDVLPLIAGYDGVAVAAVNSPTGVAVSGPADAIQALEADLREAGVTSRRVRVDRQFHGPAMDPLCDPLRAELKDIEPRPFAVPLYSTALDGVVNPCVDADYWAQHVRNQVRFAPAIAAVAADGIDTFVEIGPHGTLRGAVEETVPAYAVNTLRRGDDDTRSLLGAAAALFTRGVPLSMEILFTDDAQVVETPLVRWQKDRYWLDTTSAQPTAVPVDTPRSPEEVLLGEIADVIGVPPDRFGDGTRLRDFGLDSMLAIRLCNRVQTLFGHRVASVEFFTDRTVHELVAHLAQLGDQPQADQPQSGEPEQEFVLDELPEAEELLDEIAAHGLEDGEYQLAPAGHGQGSIWFMQQLSPLSVPYNLMVAARIPAEVDVRALGQAVRGVVERHPALRTVFVEAGAKPYQLILDEPVHEFSVVDASGLDDEQVREALSEHGHVPLDIDYGPLLRVVLLSRGPEDHHLLLVMHHVASDAMSIDVAVRDLQELYEKALREDLPRQEPVADYTRFVEWESAWLASPDADAALQWWSERLDSPPPHIDLQPSTVDRFVTYDGDDAVFRWNADDTRLLKEFALHEGVSMNTLVLAGFFATLNRVAGAEDAVVATAVAQRGEPGWESAIGYYLNTALVRAKPEGNRSFRALLDEVHEFALGMLRHMNYPLDLLVSELNPPRAEGRSPWFDFAVNWLSGDAFPYATTLFHGIGEPGPGPLPLVPCPLKRRIAKFDLEITMGEIAGDLVGQVQFKPDFLERQTVTTLLEHFHRVLFHAIRQPDLTIDELGVDL